METKPGGTEKLPTDTKRRDSLLQKCKLQRDMLAFLEKSVKNDEVIQAATVVKTITETAGEIAYEAGRYNEALIGREL